MKIRNKNGPSAEPWGTPLLIICGEDISPLRDTNCCRSFKKFLNQASSVPCIPYRDIYLSVYRGWSNQSISEHQRNMRWYIPPHLWLRTSHLWFYVNTLGIIIRKKWVELSSLCGRCSVVYFLPGVSISRETAISCLEASIKDITI